MGFELTIINSLLVTAAGMAFLTAIVRGLGAQSNTFEYTRQYVQVILLGSIFTMGNYTFGQLLRSEGSVRYSVAGMITGTVVNIILDPVFIFTLGLQIRGAAIATILGNAAGMLVSLWIYGSGKTLLTPSIQYLTPTGEILREIFWVGVPATLETLLTSAAYIVNNNLAVAYGELTVAAMGIAQKILSLGSYIYQGFAAGTQPIMASCRCHGGQRDRALCHGSLRYIRAAADRALYRLCGSDRNRKQGAAHDHVYSALCRSGLHEPHFLSGNGKASVCFCDHAGSPAGTLCTPSAASEPSVWIRRHDLGTARDRNDHDGSVRIAALRDHPKRGPGIRQSMTCAERKLYVQVVKRKGKPRCGAIARPQPRQDGKGAGYESADRQVCSFVFCRFCFLGRAPLLYIFLELFRLIVEGLGKESHFPQTVFDHIQDLLGRREQGVIVIAFCGGGQQGGFAAAYGFQEVLYIKAGADIQFSAQDSVGTVAHEDILDHGAAVYEQVQFLLTFLASVVHLEDPLALPDFGGDITLAGGDDLLPFRTQNRDIRDNDLSAHGKHFCKR